MKPSAPPSIWRAIGPGLLLAATGVGAGDLVTAAAAGSRLGLAIAWAALLGALLKFVLNEGLARWQLATGTTLLEGWVEHLGRVFGAAFSIYLFLWSFIVGGALISACGLAAHALFPSLSITSWGVLHSLLGAALVLAGGYSVFEKTVKGMIALMVLSLVGASAWITPPWETARLAIVTASVPRADLFLLLGVLGGVGGSVTMLSYGYWIREKGWKGAAYLKAVRLDLAAAYLLTGILGVVIIALAAESTRETGHALTGRSGVLELARLLGEMVGPSGERIFLLGFWGAVFTSLLGVWQGVPYLFCDFVALRRKRAGRSTDLEISTRSTAYRLFLCWLAVPPMILLRFENPQAVILTYAVAGALFMPILAATLIYLNRRCLPPGASLATGWLGRMTLWITLAFFTGLALYKLRHQFL